MVGSLSSNKFLYAIGILFVVTLPINDIAILEPIPVIKKFTLGMLLGVFLSGVWLLIIPEKRTITLHRPHLYALLFFTLAIISITWSVNPTLSILRIVRYTFSALVFFIFWDIFNCEHRIDHALQTFAVGSWALTLSIYGLYLLGMPFKQGRFSGGGFGPNGAAGIIALSLPIAWFLATTVNLHCSKRTQTLLNGANIAFIPAGLGALVLTGSRHGLVAAVVMTIPYVLWTLNDRLDSANATYAGLAAGAMVPVGYLLLITLPARLRSRLLSIPSAIANAQLENRLPRWTVGIQRWLEQPLHGYGAGTYHTAVGPHLVEQVTYIPSRFYADNIFISIPVNLGIVGIVLFLAIYVRTLRHHIGGGTKYARLWLFVFGVLFIIGSMNPWSYRPTTWALTSLAVAGLVNLD